MEKIRGISVTELCSTGVCGALISAMTRSVEELGEGVRNTDHSDRT